MPERQYLFDYDSSEVQGEGAFVKMRSLKVKDGKALKKQNAALEERLNDARHELMLAEREYEAAQDEDNIVEIESLNIRIKGIQEEIDAITDAQEQQNIDLLAKHIVDWNWCDDDGNALPLPKDDPSVLDELTIEELQFVGELLNPSSSRRKKITKALGSISKSGYGQVTDKPQKHTQT